MGSLLENIVTSAVSGSANNGALGSIIEAATGASSKSSSGNILGSVVKQAAKKAAANAIKKQAGSILTGGSSSSGIDLGSVLGSVTGATAATKTASTQDVGDKAKSLISVIGMAAAAYGISKKLKGK